jgi:hypothetical protein
LNRATDLTQWTASDPRSWRFAGDRPSEKQTRKDGSAWLGAHAAARSRQPWCPFRKRLQAANARLGSSRMGRIASHRRWWYLNSRLRPAAALVASTLTIRRNGSCGSGAWDVLIDGLRVDAQDPGGQAVTIERPGRFVRFVRYEDHTAHPGRTKAVAGKPTTRPQALTAIHGCGRPNFSDSEERHVDD